MSDTVHRCEGKLRGFAMGQCDARATVEYGGKRYCKRHDPTPAVPAPDRFVWEVWHYGRSQPNVTRYSLVKLHDKGGATVLKYGHRVTIKPASGKRFFTSEDELREYLQRWHANALEVAGRTLDRLTRVADDPMRGVTVEEISGGSRPVRPIKLKDDEP